MKTKLSARQRKVILVMLAVTVSLIFLVTLNHRRLGQGGFAVKRVNKVEYFKPYESPNKFERLSGFQNKDAAATDVAGVSVSSQDSRPEDGPLSCTIYYSDSKKVIAYYSVGSGFNAKHVVNTELIIQDSSLSLSTIKALATKYC
jgi:hypothetical protein